ncbi:hypothetical protein [Brachyspira pulli]|uniref:hypothetical protein n=1 Tax=Brachyspira pulli TaxID=310721 RepID=UPI0030040EBD
MKKLILLLLTLFMSFSLLYSDQQSRLLKKLNDRLYNDKEALRFCNACTGEDIEGATVQIDGIGTFTTDIDGIVEFDIPPDGDYVAVVSKEGYATGEFDFTVLNGVIVADLFFIPNITDLSYIQIVLSWNDTPPDLDAHLIKNNEYHISYRDMRTARDGSANLDIDARSGYGPETITIRRLDNNANYNFYIHNYTDGNNRSSDRLSRSSATVRIFHQGRLLKTFYVPNRRTGTIWNVFNIVNGKIITVNSIN